MITRATNPKYAEKFPTYSGVSVSEPFKDFQFFADWCHPQVGFGNQGWVLDKDLLSAERKLYSEETCVFLPPSVNSFLMRRAAVRNLPLGVTWCESEGKYKAYCSQLNGKNKTLGRFNNSEEASRAYNTFKLGLRDKLLQEFSTQIDERAVIALKEYTI
jgi:hypothetical protein